MAGIKLPNRSKSVKRTTESALRFMDSGIWCPPVPTDKIGGLFSGARFTDATGREAAEESSQT